MADFKSRWPVLFTAKEVNVLNVLKFYVYLRVCAHKYRQMMTNQLAEALHSTVDKACRSFNWLTFILSLSSSSSLVSGPQFLSCP